MTKAQFAFGRWAGRRFAGWHFPGAGGWLLYRGTGGPESIDFIRPVGFAQAEAAQIASGAAHQADRTYLYALRSVSDAGVMERNTHVLCGIRKAGDGHSMSLRLPRVTDAQVRLGGEGAILLAWRLRVEPGDAWPDEIEVLRDDGAGGWDELSPLAVVAARPVAVADYGVSIPLADFTALAVRCRLGPQAGPISSLPGQVSRGSATPPTLL